MCAGGTGVDDIISNAPNGDERPVSGHSVQETWGRSVLKSTRSVFQLLWIQSPWQIGGWSASCKTNDDMTTRSISVLLMTLGLLQAGEESTALRGQVSERGSPIAGAIVTISNGEFVRSATTDANGRFALKPVPPGRYDFRTTAHGYAVFERAVTVRSEDSRRNWIEVKSLIPIDQQTVSVSELAPRLARN